MVIGILGYCWRYELSGVAFATLMTGFGGGIAFFIWTIAETHLPPDGTPNELAQRHGTDPRLVIRAWNCYTVWSPS